MALAVHVACRALYRLERSCGSVWTDRTGLCELHLFRCPCLPAGTSRCSQERLTICVWRRDGCGYGGRLYAAHCAGAAGPSCLDPVLRRSENPSEKSSCIRRRFCPSVSARICLV